MASSSCNLDVNKCRSQVELNRLLKDPILGQFLKSRGITSEDKSNATKLGGYGWISLPTTTANGTNETKSKLNINNDIINFLAIKMYNSEDSKVIYEALSQSMRSGKGTGRNILFDNHGNFAYWDGNNNKIFRNPIIPRGLLKKDEQLIAGKPGTGETNYTLFNQMSPFISGTNIYYYNEKMIANPSMTYIILTKDKVPSENSNYYLVYNPIHRKKFKEYYSHLLGYEGIWRGNKLVKAGGSGGYQKKSIDTVPTPSGGHSSVAPSFINSVARYCNALKIGGDTLTNGRGGEHYADPTCNFILSVDDANLSLITGKNHTQSNLVYEKYASVNDTEEQSRAAFRRNRRVLLKGPGNSQIHWPCKNAWPKDQKTSLQFAADQGLFGENSDSFVNVLGHAYINDFDKTLTLNNNALNIGGEGFTKQPGCKALNVNIQTCTNVIEIGGNAQGNDFAMQNACGVVRPEPVVPEPVVPEPVVPEPVVPEPVVPEPVVPEPVVPEPSKTKPVVTKPSVMDWLFNKPSETKPVVTKPSVTKPSVTKPSETKPVVTKPSVTKPSVTKPSETKPSVTKPSETKPVVTKPSVTKPSETKPVVTKPSVTKPSETKPVVTKPSVTKPYISETKPSVTKPYISEEPVLEETSETGDTLLYNIALLSTVLILLAVIYFSQK